MTCQQHTVIFPDRYGYCQYLLDRIVIHQVIPEISARQSQTTVRTTGRHFAQAICSQWLGNPFTYSRKIGFRPTFMISLLNVFTIHYDLARKHNPKPRYRSLWQSQERILPLTYQDHGWLWTPRECGLKDCTGRSSDMHTGALD